MNIGLSRLTHQRITTRSFAQPGAVVTWLGAMQAQDYLGTLWAIGLRMTHATEQGIVQALVERTIVRTWPLRGTLHFVAAQDVRWLLTLLTPRIIAQSAGRYRQLELDEATFARSQTVFANVLQGGKQLTRDEMYHHLEQANIATTGQRGYHLLVRAAQDGLICFGAPRAKQQTFTLLEEWIAPAKAWARDEALAELTRRYFASHGPATLPDFMNWAGLTVAEAKIGLAGAQLHLLQETIDNRVYWFAPALPDAKNAIPVAHLLPGFDEYLLGYKDRSAVLDPTYASRICPGGNGVFYPTIVINGQVVGTWKRVLKKDKVLIMLDPFQPLRAVEIQAVTAAAERYGAFLGLPVILA